MNSIDTEFLDYAAEACETLMCKQAGKFDVLKAGWGAVKTGWSKLRAPKVTAQGAKRIKDAFGRHVARAAKNGTPVRDFAEFSKRMTSSQAFKGNAKLNRTLWNAGKQLAYNNPLEATSAAVSAGALTNAIFDPLGRQEYEKNKIREDAIDYAVTRFQSGDYDEFKPTKA